MQERTCSWSRQTSERERSRRLLKGLEFWRIQLQRLARRSPFLHPLEAIKRTLDAGALGVIFPHIHSPDDAQAAVREALMRKTHSGMGLRSFGGRRLRQPKIDRTGAFISIGVYFARKNQSAEEYFLSGRNLPGWLVGCSVMATIVSAVTFLATPGFAYKNDWRYIPWNLGYLLALLPAIVLFMPLFRRTKVQSAYEYLERRFGTWARLYSAGLFVIWIICRMSISNVHNGFEY